MTARGTLQFAIKLIQYKIDEYFTQSLATIVTIISLRLTQRDIKTIGVDTALKKTTGAAHED